MKSLRSTVIPLFALAIAYFASPLSARADVITAKLFADGQEIGSFTELAGILSGVEPNAYWETDGNEITVNRLAGKRALPSVILRRQVGGTEITPIDQWHELVASGAINSAKRSVTLRIYTDGTVTAAYFLENAWPSKVEIAQVNLGDAKKPQEVLMETVVLVCENIQRVAP